METVSVTSGRDGGRAVSAPAHAIELAGAGKAYRRYPSPWARLAEWMWPRRPRHTPHWVLRGLTLQVPRGQALGIVGRNGAGKSTLLKLITGTTAPTEGTIRVHGRVAALLELGMGFHPDFTGEQNVLMAGQLMGLTAAELRTQLPAITAFSGIGEYLYAPLRTYSSGMQMRLAFSLATAVRPDVLIVDEALAVGDLAFQHQCYARLREFRRAGTTLLFVSHDPGAVKSLCERAVLLDGGQVVADGAPDQVLDMYNALIARLENEAGTAGFELDAATGGVRSGDGRARLLGVTVENPVGPVQVLRVGEPLRLRIRAVKRQALQDLTVGFLVRDRLGNEVFGTNTWHAPLPGLAQLPPGRPFTVCWDVPALHLGPGSYSVTVALHGDMTHLDENYDWWDQAAHFQVVRGPEPLFEGVCHWPGVRPRLELEDGGKTPAHEEETTHGGIRNPRS